MLTGQLKAFNMHDEHYNEENTLEKPERRDKTPDDYTQLLSNDHIASTNPTCLTSFSPIKLSETKRHNYLSFVMTQHITSNMKQAYFKDTGNTSGPGLTTKMS